MMNGESSERVSSRVQGVSVGKGAVQGERRKGMGDRRKTRGDRRKGRRT